MFTQTRQPGDPGCKMLMETLMEPSALVFRMLLGHILYFGMMNPVNFAD